MAVTATVVFPGTGTESAILVTMTAGDEMVCTGTAGAPATCIHVSVETADVPAAVVPATTETFSAVRTPAFTIVSSGALARGPTAFMLGVAALSVGVVSCCAVL